MDRLRRALVGSLVASIVTGTSAIAAAAPRSHHGDVLVQVEAWPHEAEALGLDVWTHRTALRSVLARVPPTRQAALDASGYDYVTVDPDLGARVEAEQTRLKTRPPVLHGGLGGGLDPTYHLDYRELAAVHARLDALAAAVPERVTPVDVGLSLEGRSIRGVRITNPGPADRPVVLVQGGQHAREWVAVAAPVYAAEQLATAALGSPLDALLDEVEVVVVPVVNPDGYVYSWDVERFWRKNRRNDHGVDLNRNWSVAWGGDGASPDPWAEDHHGAAPFSEPESAAMRDLIDADPDLVAMLDVHAYGQLLLYPWGFGYDEAPDDASFAAMTMDMADAMGLPYQEQYVPIQSSDLYPAAGNAADWAYGVHGVYAIGLELRPQFEEEWGFLLPPEFIVPTGEELLAAITELAEASLVLGPGTPGDSDGGGMDTGTTGTTSGGSSTGEGLDGTTGTSSAESTSGSSTGEVPPAGTTGLELPGGTEDTGEPAADGDEPGATGDGCGCRAGPHGHGAGAWPWLLAVAGGLRMRRRRAAAR